MASTIIGIIIIIAFTILMIFLICLMLQEKIEKVIYKIPFITKKVERHKVNKRIKDTFNSVVYDQNKRISMAMMEGKKYTTFIFANDNYYFNPWNMYKNQYRKILLDMGMKYCKKYKIDGDKISWD